MRRRRAFLTVATVTVALATVSGGMYAYSDEESDKPKPVAKTDSSSPSSSSSPSQSSEPEPRPTNEPDADHECGDVGKYQREVETTLASLGEYGTIYVDGEQSVEDCEAIKKFQKKMGISPVEGYAGDVTKRVADRIASSDTNKCSAGKGKTVCVDLTHQTLWVVEDGKQVMAPTVVRTGMSGYATTAGTWKIYDRSQTHWSRPYKVWLPYWQNFHNGQGLHETTTYLHDSFGSHGCVNLLHKDADKLYQMLGLGDTIEVFGHRPGT